ncbi:hypothetical protein AYW79_11090 [Ferroacidibacillus organovorans]|uniref:DUF1294 domain-containing protein n=1 Tax=Ferroacidibacillus organovorans TaxID=1765683 RepID=A0A853K8Q9_9BACL|nr:hypothetical protein AYJ22_11570 [Ferroacidibacillus organovorans]OAG93355.1 hypothetical protein AYW79_11090 [Ferroacidibacillus organovorans]
MVYFLCWCLALSTLSFFLMLYDKRASKRRKRRRIRERTLLLLTVGGGGLGTWIAMRVFHHKTRHTSFRIMAPVSSIGWTVLALYLLDRGIL